MGDFSECRITKLKNISVLKRDYFENVQKKDLKDLQFSRNHEKILYQKEILLPGEKSKEAKLKSQFSIGSGHSDAFSR